MMGQPKQRSGRGGVRAGRKAKRARRGAKQRTKNLKRALGIPKHEILPHVVGRRDWRGMRDHAPELNGPVRVRKVGT